MLPLFIWATIGVVVHLIINNDYSKSSLITHGVMVVLAAIGAYFGASANLAGWVLKAFYAAGGFMLTFAILKLKSISNQAK